VEIKRNIIWRTTKYGKNRKIKFWSKKIKGVGDGTLPKDSLSRRGWNKVIILEPIGDPETTFSIGFIPAFGDTKVSDTKRKIRKGPFGMRLCPDVCEFFITSNDGEVQLKLVGYAHMGDKTKSGLHLY